MLKHKYFGIKFLWASWHQTLHIWHKGLPGWRIALVKTQNAIEEMTVTHATMRQTIEGVGCMIFLTISVTNPALLNDLVTWKINCCYTVHPNCLNTTLDKQCWNWGRVPYKSEQQQTCEITDFCWLHTSGFLCSIDWQLDTDTFRWSVGPNFKGQVVQEFKSATVERYTMHKLHTNKGDCMANTYLMDQCTLK